MASDESSASGMAAVLARKADVAWVMVLSPDSGGKYRAVVFAHGKTDPTARSKPMALGPLAQWGRKEVAGLQPATRVDVTGSSGAAARRPWAWALLGTGVAGLVAGAALSIVGQQAYNEVDDADRSGQRVVGIGAREARDAVNRGDSLTLGSIIAYSLGGALVAGAVLWLVLDRDSPAAPRATGPRWRMLPGPGSLAVRVDF